MLGAAAELFPAGGDPKKPRSASALGPLPGSVAGVGGRVTNRSFAIVRDVSFSLAAPTAGLASMPAAVIQSAVARSRATWLRFARRTVFGLPVTYGLHGTTVNGVAVMQRGTVSWKVYGGKKANGD